MFECREPLPVKVVLQAVRTGPAVVPPLKVVRVQAVVQPGQLVQPQLWPEVHAVLPALGPLVRRAIKELLNHTQVNIYQNRSRGVIIMEGMIKHFYKIFFIL